MTESRRGWLRALRLAVVGLVILYLVHRIAQTGWQEIMAALPSSPLFYLLSIAIFLVLPVSETFCYRLLTGSFIPQGLRVFIRKRVYNDAIVGFAGEAYLFAELVKLDGWDKRRALTAIKDNNIVSAIISNSWTLMLVAALIAMGQISALQGIVDQAPILVSSFAAICVIIYVMVLFFFHRISALSGRKMLQLSSIHGARLLVTVGLQLLQWSIAIPAAAATWLMFLTMQTLLTRIPGLPNSDLLFLGAGLSLVGFSGEDTILLTAMLLAATTSTQAVQLVAYLATMRGKSPDPGVFPVDFRESRDGVVRDQ